MSASSLDITANEMAGEHGKNNRYFCKQFLVGEGIYVHVDEEEENGSVTAMDHILESKPG